jgi:NAD(P)-dependent dehydrogenase (short-subunit alcohol dehydrogenase family)
MTKTYSVLGALESPSLDSPPFPSNMLSGQVAFVTGGGSGMGFGMARAFAQSGARVAIVGRTHDRLQGAVPKLQAMGVEVIAVTCDVRDPAAVAQAFEQTEQALGPVTILANNAGGNFPVLAEKMSANAWRAINQIAIDGTFLCSSMSGVVSRVMPIRPAPKPPSCT